MEAPRSASTTKSTTVRPTPFQLRMLRLALRSTSVVAPASTDRMAAKLFFKPRRSTRARAPVVAGLEAKAFQIESSRGRLAAWSWGEGPTVLLAHGWEGFAAQFVPFIRPLVEAGYRAVAFDMPAHGLSEGTHVSAIDMAAAIREVADDVMPFVGKERLAPHAIIAHSLGGAAASFAMSEGLGAERVVLLAPVADPILFAQRAASFLTLSPKRTKGMLRAVEEFAGKSFDQLDVREKARRMTASALIFHDVADAEVPFAHGRDVAAAWPGAEFVALEGLGHRRLLKDPAVVERAVQFVVEEPRLRMVR